jgi:phosphate transport system substrate-binding protein
MLQNKSGKFVNPDDDTFKAAAADADWKSVRGMGVVLTDQAGADAWPVTGASFILMHAKQEKPESGREVL